MINNSMLTRDDTMKIYLSGSVAYDRIMSFSGKFGDHILPEKIHMLNVCFTVDNLIEKFGGTAGNIAYNLALLGETPLILASVGKDFDEYGAWLSKNGLSLSGIRILAKESTASAYIITDQSDNQITGFSLGAMNQPSRYSFSKKTEKALAIISPGNIDDMLTYSRAFKELAIPYIFDPGQSLPIIPKDRLIEILTGAYIFISNDYELEMVKKATDLDLENILKRVQQAVITTLGEDGSVIVTPDEKIDILPVKAAIVLDPTGAGDAYRSGLIKGMVTGKNLLEAARMGATCASYAIEHKGTQEHHFSETQFWERHQNFFG